MITKLGKLNLTADQIKYLSTLYDGNIFSIVVWEDEGVAVEHKEDLSDVEIDTLKLALQALPDKSTPAEDAKKKRRDGLVAKLGLSEDDLQAIVELVWDTHAS